MPMMGQPTAVPGSASQTLELLTDVAEAAIHAQRAPVDGYLILSARYCSPAPGADKLGIMSLLGGDTKGAVAAQTTDATSSAMKTAAMAYLYQGTLEAGVMGFELHSGARVAVTAAGSSSEHAQAAQRAVFDRIKAAVDKAGL